MDRSIPFYPKRQAPGNGLRVSGAATSSREPMSCASEYSNGRPA